MLIHGIRCWEAQREEKKKEKCVGTGEYKTEGRELYFFSPLHLVINEENMGK